MRRITVYTARSLVMVRKTGCQRMELNQAYDPWFSRRVLLSLVGLVGLSVPLNQFGFCHFERALEALSSRVSHDTARKRGEKAAVITSEHQGKRKMYEAHDESRELFLRFPRAEVSSPRVVGRRGGKNSSIDAVHSVVVRTFVNTGSHAYRTLHSWARLVP